MYKLKCQNHSCDARDTIKELDKITYIIQGDSLYSPQMICDICGNKMEDVTEFEGFPIKGVPKGSSNPLIGR